MCLLTCLLTFGQMRRSLWSSAVLWNIHHTDAAFPDCKPHVCSIWGKDYRHGTLHGCVCFVLWIKASQGDLWCWATVQCHTASGQGLLLIPSLQLLCMDWVRSSVVPAGAAVPADIGDMSYHMLLCFCGWPMMAAIKHTCLFFELHNHEGGNYIGNTGVSHSLATEMALGPPVTAPK